MISVQPRDAEGCRIYYGAETAVGATPISATTESTTSLSIDVSDSACAYNIYGTLTGSNGAPIRYRQVVAVASDRSQMGTATPLEVKGEFVIAVPGDGRYRLSFELELGCTVFRTEQGVVSSDQEIGDDDLITVAGGDVRLDVAIPARPCGLPIRVKVRDSEGMPRTATDIRAYHKDTDTWTYPRSRDIDSGLFHLPVTPGTYRFYVDLAHGCGGFATISGLTFFGQDQAHQFQVADTPIDIDLQVPVGTCQYEITGTLTHEGGSPTEGFWVWFERNDIATPALVAEDGTFGRVVPDLGNYALWYSWPDQRCRVYVLGNTITLNPADAESVEVVNADVRHDIRIPAGTCEYSVSGTIARTDGTVIDGRDITLRLENVRGQPGISGHLTAEDGSFTVYGSQLDAYYLNITIQTADDFARGERCVLYAVDGSVTQDRERAQVFNVNTEGTPRDINIRIPSDACE